MPLKCVLQEKESSISIESDVTAVCVEVKLHLKKNKQTWIRNPPKNMGDSATTAV